MGCDIHMCFEHNSVYDGVQKWRNEDLWEWDYYDSVYQVVPCYRDRDYNLFGLLAGVRDGLNPPTSDPRGLPDDVCERTKSQSDVWGVDGHSHSWLLLSEIINQSKRVTSIKQCGYVSPEDAKKLDEGIGTPYAWCGWTSNETWVYREWEDKCNPFDNLLNQVYEFGCKTYKWFSREMMEENAEKFRLVFWFDN